MDVTGVALPDARGSDICDQPSFGANKTALIAMEGGVELAPRESRMPICVTQID